MRDHHMKACPLGGALMDGVSTNGLAARLTTHCLLLEMDRSHVLVDTGYGLRDVHDPRSRLSRFFLALNRPELREEMTAFRQIQRFGLDPRDVRHIVLSHLDFDHAGGLDDFGAGQPWFGFECVRDLGLGPDVLMVPLVGHTLGHAGIAVRRDDGWLLYAADAYFYWAETNEKPRCTPGLRAYQTMMEKDRRSRLGGCAEARQTSSTPPEGASRACTSSTPRRAREARCEEGDVCSGSSCPFVCTCLRASPTRRRTAGCATYSRRASS